MALPSFLKRKSPAAPVQGDEAIVQRARASARRRLIGAAVLLAGGVIAFPLLFETQPRPIPVDIPIDIPRKDGLPPLAPPAKSARAVTGQVTEPAARAPAGATSPSGPSALPASAPTPAAATSKPVAPAQPAATVPAAPAPKPAPVPSPAPAKAPEPTTQAPATATPAVSAPAKAPSASAPQEAAAPGRYVVQVGAFAEVAAAREVRLKVEKLGLKTYTQVVETGQGKRIRVRVGPFESQDEAAKVLARLKAAQLPGAVLTL
jgi:DedD protein